GVLVENLLKPGVELLALGEQIIKLGFAQDRAQRRLRELRRSVEIVFDLQNRKKRIDYSKVNDRVYGHGHVVSSDDVLRRHVEDNGSKAHANHAIDRAKDQHDSRSLWPRENAPESEHNAEFVLGHYVDDAQDVDDEDHDRYYRQGQELLDHTRSSTSSVTNREAISIASSGPDALKTRLSPKLEKKLSASPGPKSMTTGLRAFTASAISAAVPGPSPQAKTTSLESTLTLLRA